MPLLGILRYLHDICVTVLAKIISGLPDKMSGRPSMLCRTFWSLAGHFSQLMTGNSCLPCRTFSLYGTLLDKMSGNVGTLCRTSAEVCRTCPAYFARTDLCHRYQKGVLSHYHDMIFISWKWRAFAGSCLHLPWKNSPLLDILVNSLITLVNLFYLPPLIQCSQFQRNEYICIAKDSALTWHNLCLMEVTSSLQEVSSI